MSQENPISMDELQQGLQDVLQERDVERVLDSLETVVTISYFMGKNYRGAAALDPKPTTIRGWMQWAQRSSPSG